MRNLIPLLIGFAAGFVLAMALFATKTENTATATRHVIARYPDGAIHSEYDLDASGYVHGTMIDYHRNGQVSVVQEFKHGEATGTSEHYDETGEAQ